MTSALVSSSDCDSTYSARIVVEHGECVIHLSGELDLSNGARAMRSCLDAGRPIVRVDLRGLTFMDSGGYSGLDAARMELERRGGSLTLTGAVGEPAHLLDLLGVRWRSS